MSIFRYSKYGKKCFNCGETVYESFLKHNTTCQKVYCLICKSSLPKHDHCLQCKEIVKNPAVHQHCQHCSKVVTNDDLKEHERTCPERIHTCEDCKSQIRNCEIMTHECKCELCLIDIVFRLKVTHQCDQLVVLKRLNQENVELRENYTELEKEFARMAKKFTRFMSSSRGRSHRVKRDLGGYDSDPQYDYINCDCIRGYDHDESTDSEDSEDSE